MRSHTLRVVLLVAILFVPSLTLAEPWATVSQAAPPAVDAWPSEVDVTLVLLRLAEGDTGVLDAITPLATGQSVDVPADLLTRVRAPPPLEETLAALASPARLAEVDAAVSEARIPADIARAVSSLGQAVLGAQQLARADRPSDGAALLLAAIGDARPALERHAVLLAYPEAFGETARDEPGTHALVSDALAARDADAALAALGISRAPAVGVSPLSTELAELYARLGLPLTAHDRAALAVADALDPALAEPLAGALAHVLAAIEARDAAFVGLDDLDRRALGAGHAVQDALRAPSPTADDVALLAAYGEAVRRIDAPQMSLAQGHLLSAGDLLSGMPRLPATPFTGQSSGDPARSRASVGGLTAEVRTGGTLAVRVVPDGAAPSWEVAGDAVRFDPERGQLVVYEDLDGDQRVDPGESRFATTPLASPERDVLFADPYRLVVVTGASASWTGADGGRLVQVEGPTQPPRPDPSAIAAFDAALAERPSYGAWPFVSAEARRMVEGMANATPGTGLSLRVNPAGYQVLHWDLGGDDLYSTNAAGAGDAGLLAFGTRVAPLSPNATREPIPASILVDLGGNDRYESFDAHTIASANRSVALLVDAAGDDTYHHRGVAHAVASARQGGSAVLLDAGGRDRYRAGSHSVALAGAAATALLADARGNDTYAAGNTSIAVADLGHAALLLDASGDDQYASQNFSQAASRGGFAALLEFGGNDTYAATNATSHAFAEPSSGSACIAADACAGTSFAARLAILADLGGTDSGACDRATLSNRALGRVGMARPLPASGPYEPAFGACLDIEAAPSDDDRRGLVHVPETFFASSAGNVTLPGVVRVGTLGDDEESGWFALQVDLNGNDTYRRGAVARLNATRFAGDPNDAGEVGPVALLLDLDGANVFDGEGSHSGAFGYAAGGVAVQAALATRRVPWERHVPRNETGAPGVDRWNETYGVPKDNVTDRSRLAPPVSENRFINVTLGLAAAEAGGVAIVLSDGYRTNVSGLPPSVAPASCRLACAREGGSALFVSEGGPGDLVVATPYSLGAVHEGPLGGVALYARRGPADEYRGSNESMGVVRRDAATLTSPARPSIALFVKDGFAKDQYDAAMLLPGLERRPRGNDIAWEDNETFSSWKPNSNGKAPVFARGIDNLDWYLHMNVASAERGAAPGAGPGSPFHSTNPWGSLSTTAWKTWWASPTTAATNRSAAPGSLVNGTLRGDPSSMLPARAPGADHGDGRSSTSPDGLRPVTLARTPLSPIVNVTQVKSAGPAVQPWQLRDLAGEVEFTFHVRDPPAYADETYGTGVTKDGTATERIELVVRGTSARWNGCPWPELTDAIDPSACLIVAWDRGVHGQETKVAPPGNPGSIARVDLANWTVRLNTVVRGPDGLPAYPPGPYAVSLRAYAARTTTMRTPLFDGDQVVEASASDAVNGTDDSYGYYGSAYHISVPIYNAPLRLGPSTVVDANATSPLHYRFDVTEPVRYWANITTRPPPLSTEPPRRVASLAGTSALFGDPDAFFQAGSDSVEISWNASAFEAGSFRIDVHLIGELSDKRATFSESQVYKDTAVPAGFADPRGVPEIVNATTAPGGRILLTMGRDEDSSTLQGSRVVAAHVWVRETLLDPADGESVLTQGTWSYAGANRDLGSLEIPEGVEPQPRTDDGDWFTVPFQAPTERGPPREYEFILMPEDRAGNRALAEPWNHTPVGCAPDACIRLRYDVTPPRTKAELVEPAPESPRIREGEVRFAVDASESPDAARIDAYFTTVRPDAPSQLETALLGQDLAPLPPGKRNVTLLPATGFVVHGEGLLPADSDFGVHLNISTTEAFTPEKPLVVPIRIVDAKGEPVGDVLEADLTGRVIDRGTSFVVVEGLLSPALPGIYVIEAEVLPPELDVNVTSNKMRVPFVVWGRAPATSGQGRVPAPADAPHGSELFVLVRGTDRAGNVEEAVDYDLRVEVDREPPTLLDAPRLLARSDGASLELVTSEPAEAALVMPGFPNATTPLDTAHVLVLEGLAPDTTYAYELILRDAVGNVALPVAGNISTSRILDVSIDPAPSLVAAPWRVTWRATNASEAPVEHRVLLSTDGGLTFPHEVLPPATTMPGDEEARVAVLDPSQWPESDAAVVRVEARALGVTRSASTGPFVLDGHAPLVAVDAERGLREYAARVATLNVSGEDPGSGVERVEWSFDNTTFASLDGSFTTFDVVGDAPRDVHIRAVDRAGNVRTQAPLRVLLDGAPPVIDGSAPPTVAGTRALVRIQVEDALSGLIRVVVRDEANWSSTLLPDAFVAGRADLVWPLGGGDGEHALHLTAEDAAGNVANSTLTTRVDRTPPTLGASLSGATSTSVRLILTATEPARVEADVTGRGVAATYATEVGREGSMASALDLTGLHPGRTYQVDVKVRDAAGNLGRLPLTVATPPDTTPPGQVPGLLANDERDGIVLLRWEPAADDHVVEKYHLLRRHAEGEWRVVAITPGLVHVDDRASLGVPVEYVVRAIDGSGNVGAFSEPVGASRRTAPSVIGVEQLHEGDRLVVRVHLSDEDGDVPSLDVHVGSVADRVELTAVDGEWIGKARLPFPQVSFGEATGFHLVARDGRFETRDPPAGEHPLRAVASTTADGLPFLTVRAAPAAGLLVLLGALAAAGIWRARR